MLTHDSRQLPSWLIFDVGRKMNISVAHDLTLASASMRTLSVKVLRHALGEPAAIETIPMHGGGVRYRDRWPTFGIAALRDDEEEAVCLAIDPLLAEVDVAGVRLPDAEQEFVSAFPAAKRNIGHSFVLSLDRWRIDVTFTLRKKRRGTGSSLRRLSGVIIGVQKEPNKAPEPTPGSVTSRADARVAPAPVVAHL